VGGGRWCVAPEFVDQLLSGDGLAPGEQQQHQQGSRLVPAKDEGLVAIDDVDLAEHSELQLVS
jgi:hypothetical protein